MNQMQIWSGRSKMDYAPHPYLVLFDAVAVSQIHGTVQEVFVFKPGWLQLLWILVHIFYPEALSHILRPLVMRDSCLRDNMFYLHWVRAMEYVSMQRMSEVDNKARQEAS